MLLQWFFQECLEGKNETGVLPRSFNETMTKTVLREKSLSPALVVAELAFQRRTRHLQKRIPRDIILIIRQFCSDIRCEVCDEGTPVLSRNSDGDWCFWCITCTLLSLPDNHTSWWLSMVTSSAKATRADDHGSDSQALDDDCTSTLGHAHANAYS